MPLWLMPEDILIFLSF